MKCKGCGENIPAPVQTMSDTWIISDCPLCGERRSYLPPEIFRGRLKTKDSKAPIPVPEQVRPVIEAWHKACKDPSPEALMFPTFGRGIRKGQAVPRWGKNFLTWRIHPIARKLGIPDRLVTFQVMRRTLGTDMQSHGTLKDTQSVLRHASIQTTGDVYMQKIDESVVQAVNSRTEAVLGGTQISTEKLAAPGKKLRPPKAIRRSLMWG